MLRWQDGSLASGKGIAAQAPPPPKALDSLGWKLEMIDRNKGRVLTETGLLGE